MIACMQDTFARATHSANMVSAARDDRVYYIQDDCSKTVGEDRFSGSIFRAEDWNRARNTITLQR